MNEITKGQRIIAIDVGGTNICCAVMEYTGNNFLKLISERYSTQSAKNLIEPLKLFFKKIAESGIEKPLYAGVSAAGPLTGRKVVMTNALWDVYADEIEKEFSIKVFLINDFTAISWGILLLDKDKPDELLCLSKEETKKSEKVNNTMLVLGAGTGLGCGYILNENGKTFVHSSEGGHICVPNFDEQSRRFSVWLEKNVGEYPSAEDSVSGQGIHNIFSFMISEQKEIDDDCKAILEVPAIDRPAQISKFAAKGNKVCVETMALFVKLYARIANALSATFLPYGGVYLAGGIAAKNKQFFTEENRFIDTYIGSTREHIKKICSSVPVYIVTNYDISLFGDANAVLNMIKNENC